MSLQFWLLEEKVKKKKIVAGMARAESVCWVGRGRGWGHLSRAHLSI